jgi:hypothetical protein
MNLRPVWATQNDCLKKKNQKLSKCLTKINKLLHTQYCVAITENIMKVAESWATVCDFIINEKGKLLEYCQNYVKIASIIGQRLGEI